MRAFLEDADSLRTDVEVPEEQMRPGSGWNLVQSNAVITHERPGPPEEDGAFERARQLVESFAFSDPRIVTGHYDPERALDGRVVLLELQSLGLHFLSPVRIGAVRSESTDEQTVFGFRFDTLPGHVEVGREWFLVAKDHVTGQVRFRIRAAWKEGDLTTWWMRIGFSVVGRRYQRAWHHLAHLRLRKMVMMAGGPRAAPVTDGLAHEGPPLNEWKLLLYGGRSLGVRLTRVESETERMRRDRWLTVAGLGVMAGMRSMSAPALMAHYYKRRPPRHRGPLVRFLRKRNTRRALTSLAAGELVADKLPITPARIEPPALAGRALSGAFVGAALADSATRSRWRMGLLGASTALASSFGFYRLRQLAVERWKLPAPAAGFLEDLATGALGAGLMTTMERAYGRASR